MIYQGTMRWPVDGRRVVSKHNAAEKFIVASRERLNLKSTPYCFHLKFGFFNPQTQLYVVLKANN